MERKFQLAENERHLFCAPVEVTWTDQSGQAFITSGQTLDVSVYGLGVVIPIELAVNTGVRVTVCGVYVCGSATVRYSQRTPSGFKTGLQFELTLFMQAIPGLDAVLAKSLRSVTDDSPKNSLFRKLVPIWIQSGQGSIRTRADSNEGRSVDRSGLL